MQILLVAVPQKVRRVMKMAGIDKIMQVFDTRQQALDSLSA